MNSFRTKIMTVFSIVSILSMQSTNGMFNSCKNSDQPQYTNNPYLQNFINTEIVPVNTENVPVNTVLFQNFCYDLKYTIDNNFYNVKKLWNRNCSIFRKFLNIPQKIYSSMSPYCKQHIPNLSVINFASKGWIGNTIRWCSKNNEVTNPCGLSHSGICVNLDPKDLHDLILNKLPNNANKYKEDKKLSVKECEAILSELNTYHSDAITRKNTNKKEYVCFVIESDGSAAEVLKGILPHVHIHSLAPRLLQYEGNVFVRQLNKSPDDKALDNEQTLQMVKKYLGVPYENNPVELVNSIKGYNKKERTEHLFCSELVASILKDYKIMNNNIIASNVIPEQLSSFSSYDVLTQTNGVIFSKDLALKVMCETNQ